MRHLVIALLSIIYPLAFYAQYSIEGQLDLDESWERTIYLSIIPDMDAKYKSSDQLIIAKAPIQADGYFQLKGNLFPEQEHLVRLHISKKNDPPATLIIGGRDENHCFLSLSNNSQLRLSTVTTGLFDHFRINADPSNQALFWVDSTIQYFNAIDTGFNSLSYKNMVREEQAETLFGYADTTEHLLSAIYAIYHADQGYNSNEVRLHQNKLVQRLGTHPYLDIPIIVTTPSSGISYWWWLLLLVIITLGFYIWWNNRKPKVLKLLSYQEQKILGQLVDGKSNKEIANKMHIETTTVKSHVYNIYNKLKISSRKEAHQFKKWVKKK